MEKSEVKRQFKVGDIVIYKNAEYKNRFEIMTIGYYNNDSDQFGVRCIESGGRITEYLNNRNKRLWLLNSRDIELDQNFFNKTKINQILGIENE